MSCKCGALVLFVSVASDAASLLRRRSWPEGRNYAAGNEGEENDASCFNQRIVPPATPPPFSPPLTNACHQAERAPQRVQSQRHGIAIRQDLLLHYNASAEFLRSTE